MLLKFNFGDEQYTASTEELFTINADNPEALAYDLQQNPSLTFFWGFLAEKAAIKLEKLENDFEVWYSIHYEKAREKLMNDESIPNSKISESMIKNVVICDNLDDWNKWKNEISKWTYYKKMLSRIEARLKHKSDVLINLLSYYKMHMEEQR